MSGSDIAQVGAALTSDGTSAGVVTIASTSAWKVGMKAFISDNNSVHKEVIVIEITDSTHMVVRFTTPIPNAPNQGQNLGYNGENYGTSDISSYTVAQSARIDAARQFIYNA